MNWLASNLANQNSKNKPPQMSKNNLFGGSFTLAIWAAILLPKMHAKGILRVSHSSKISMMQSSWSVLHL
jgi:hypothetical protein